MLQNFGPLKQRLIFSTFAITIVALTLATSFHPFLSLLVPLLTSAIIGLALKEYYTIAIQKGFHPKVFLGLSMAFLSIFSIFFSTQTPLLDTLPLLTLGLTLIAVFAAYIIKGKDPFVNIAITLFGIFYLAIPLSCVIKINYFFPENGLQDGRFWLAFLIATTYITDSAALIAGKTFGRRLLAPYISPKKTWEGAIGGLAGATITALIFYTLSIASIIPIKLTIYNSLFLGIILSLLAQFGDLAESLLKRDAGVKDSSSIPGMGGMLDIVDSLIFTAPFLYLYLKLAPLTS